MMTCILLTSINVSEVQLTESVAASSDMIAQSRDDKIPSKDSYGIPLQKLLFCCCNSEDWGRSKSRVGTLTLTTSTLRVWSISSQAVTLLSQWGLALSKQQFKIDCYFQSSEVPWNSQDFKVSDNQPTCKNHILANFIDSYILFASSNASDSSVR